MRLRGPEFEDWLISETANAAIALTLSLSMSAGHNPPGMHWSSGMLLLLLRSTLLDGSLHLKLDNWRVLVQL